MGWIAERRQRQAEAATIELNQLLGEGWDSEENLAAARLDADEEERELRGNWEEQNKLHWHQRDCWWTTTNEGVVISLVAVCVLFWLFGQLF
jgi:hypothetical protein